MPSERERNEGFRLGPEPFSNSFSGTATAERYVEVIHGVYAHPLPIVGMTIAQARSDLQDRMHIDPQAVAVVDGAEVGEETVLQEGQVLNFVKRAGEKG